MIAAAPVEKRLAAVFIFLLLLVSAPAAHASEQAQVLRLRIISQYPYVVLLAHLALKNTEATDDPYVLEKLAERMVSARVFAKLRNGEVLSGGRR